MLAVCDRQVLIRCELFAIDGVEMPSNTSKQQSGIRADVERQATRFEAAATTMLERHRANDTADAEPTLTAKRQQRHERLTRDVWTTGYDGRAGVW